MLAFGEAKAAEATRAAEVASMQINMQAMAGPKELAKALQEAEFKPNGGSLSLSTHLAADAAAVAAAAAAAAAASVHGGSGGRGGGSRCRGLAAWRLWEQTSRPLLVQGATRSKSRNVGNCWYQ